MGSKHSQNNQYSDDKRILFEFIKKVNKNHFEFLHVVGKGGFGKVH
jgi:chromosome condensin MukBEF ATPase and DNA-binding subunit MukB